MGHDRGATCRQLAQGPRRNHGTLPSMIKTLSDALAERGYETLTAVQEAVTDPDLRDSDLLVSAQTGSGKTVGFGLAIAHTLMGESERMGPASAPLALVVAPTRELATQVMRELGWLYANTGARVVSCVGGSDMRDERRALERGAHIVVGTPGRLRDHIQRGSLVMEDLRAVVLDEADEMLDLGFREDLEFMLGQAPESRRTLMFSATVPPSIATLAKQYQRDARRVTTQAGTSQHADIAYQALKVAQSDSEHAIINLLRFHDAQNAIVFANTRAAVSHLTARLANRGFAVVSLSGELSQTERTHALQAMRDGRARVCVATDVAARGIDLPKLELVIHADLPSNPDALLHRSGRTGRAGRKGISALIVPPRIVKKAEWLLKLAKITAEWTTPPGADDILHRDEERLLEDPAWNEGISEAQAGFAAKLLEKFTPEQIAAGYLRLYHAGRSAPEELSPPDARPERKPHKPFGPSVWFALSVGRNERAEARWLLPLLCRAGNLDKEAIGAIRVQDSETFVELTQASAAGFLANLGDGSVLEDGVTVRALDGAPDLDRPRKAPSGRDSKRDARPPREHKPHQPKAPRDDAAPREPAKPEAAEPVKKRWVPEATETDRPEKPAGKPYGKRDDKPRGEKPAGKPYGKPAGKPGGKPYGKSDGKPGGKPFGKSDGKPGGKPFGKPGGKPYGKSDGKPSGKPGDKPAGKPYGKPGAKPAGARPNAADPSKRMERPGKPGGKPGAGKPKGKPRPGGANDRPRRQK
jgi:ATP-dependent RNA helicase DeaD